MAKIGTLRPEIEERPADGIAAERAPKAGKTAANRVPKVSKIAAKRTPEAYSGRRKYAKKLQKYGYFAKENDYLFSEVKTAADAFFAAHPEKERLDLGVGDVAGPLFPAGVKAAGIAAKEMGERATFRGYPPACGYDFLREKIAENYASYGVAIGKNEVFVSDGAKTHLGFLSRLIPAWVSAFIQTPGYPVYGDVSAALGRKTRYLAGTEENGFLPPPPWHYKKPCLLFLCSPNNPTGSVFPRGKLKEYVDYCQETGSILVFDAAYRAFVQGDFPRSVYEIPGAETCAVEVCSFSKSAGTTGIRCGYTVLPESVRLCGMQLNCAFQKYVATEQNGVSYLSQRVAEAALSPAGLKENAARIRETLAAVKTIKGAFVSSGAVVYGGEHSPYLFVKAPYYLSGESFCRVLLERFGIVAVPGSGFGVPGEGYIRLSALGGRETAEKVAAALSKAPGLFDG